MGHVKIVLRQPQDSFKIVSGYLSFDVIGLLDPRDFFNFLDFLVKTDLIEAQDSLKAASREL